MAHLNKLSLIAAILIVTICAVQRARAAEPPADLCSLLPASDLSKALGIPYDPPQKSVAPRPFPNTAQGTDCTYKQSNDATGKKLLFRVYVDPSPAAAADLFSRLSVFYTPPTPVTGVGDKAYFDKSHGLHVLKGKARFFIAMDGFTPGKEKQLETIASQIAAKL